MQPKARLRAARVEFIRELPERQAANSHSQPGPVEQKEAAGSQSAEQPTDMEASALYAPAPGSQPLAPGPWPLVPGPWPLAPGPWPLGNEAWDLSFADHFLAPWSHPMPIGWAVARGDCPPSAGPPPALLPGGHPSASGLVGRRPGVLAPRAPDTRF